MDVRTGFESHLNALEFGLHNERIRLANAKSAGEIAHRTVWVRQYEEQIASERKFLGLPEVEAVIEMTVDEIMAELDLW